MKKILFLSFLALFTFINVHTSKASHIAGGDISYTCIGNNQYQINLNLFVDCLGFDPGASQTITFTSTCGGSQTIQVNVTNPGGTEISQLCPSQINNSTCNGGSLPGMWVFNFVGTVTLNPSCNTWTAGWGVCCRNNAILNLTNAASQNSYIETTMNTLTNPCNNSPAFTAQPIPYVCINQQVNYSYGVVETDGDSLYYTLVSALSASGAPLGYNGGYSPTSPIPGIVLDPTTGLLTFTPTMLGNFVVVVLVQEYDSNGNLLGTVMRDIQFIVQNCSNIVPDPTAGAISNMTGTAVQTGPFSIEMCEGSTFTFNAVYTDVNAGDILTLTTNLNTVLPGATLTTSGTNPLTATYTWIAPGGSANTNTTFSVTVNDGACPVQGQQTFVYDIQVLPRTLGGPDQIICGSQTAQLSGTGGSVFTWNVLSGPAMVVGTNFSCNPCQNPTASPTATTVYEVVSDLSGTCVNRDTITVTVVPDYTFAVSQSSTVSCLTQPIQLNVTPSPAGAYTYSWSPGTALNNTNIANPVVSMTSPGTITYTVSVTSPQGCVKTDVVSVTATASFPPNAISFVSDTSVCTGDTVNLGVTFGNSVPSVCGPSVTGGCAATVLYTVGTGNLTTNAYPTPFTSFWEDGRIQILYLASELNALGMTGGKIASAAFNIVTKGSTTPFNGFTISMKCTSLTALTTTYQTGFTTVYGPINTSTTLGWNTYNFTTAYEWDGISNIIVEVCYNNAAWTQNDVVQKTLTPFNSSILQYTDGAIGCNLNAPTTYTERPNIRFTACGAIADTSAYTYSWTPTLGTFNPSSQFTGAQVNASTTYTVVVTNASGCADTATVFVSSGVTSLNVDAGTYTVICPTTSTTLNATGATDFTWSPATGLSNPNIANPIATPTTTTTYTVTGTSQCAVGVSTDTVTIAPVNTVILNVSAGADTTLCPGMATVLNASGATSYTWLPATGLSSTTIANPTSSVASTTTYTVTGTAFCADPVTDEVTVNILTANSYAVAAGPDLSICVGESFNLNAFVSGGFGSNSFSWNQDGLTTDSIANANTANASVNATIGGTNTYIVTVTDFCGNSVNDTVNVEVIAECDLEVPNIFTPNNDGNNDAFVIRGTGILSYSINIFNRWGNKIFESTNINDSWTGGGASDGTYFYIITAKTKNGKEFNEKGYVQLVNGN
ncbi:MAG: gliding motility-associated C-terminal domain-containing protein [Bacteroidia bacterium]|nr:gliding motility-associated C-terminal domain-containing protein [Bacteroidia bacterium]